MSSYAYIPLDQVVNDYVIAIQEDDYASNISDYQLRQYALRGIREFGMDISANIKSTLLDVDEQYGYVEIPCDLLALTKIGQLGADGLVYVFAENKNMNLLKDQPAEAVPDYLLGFDSYVFRNFIFESTVGRLYGMGGGQGAGEYRMNWAENRIEISMLSGTTQVVIEYISDEAKSDNPSVPTVAEEALRAYMYWKTLERKSSVPMGEKQRARSEYYNQLRLANARMKSFSKDDALQIIRRNFRLSPKA
jgi:hypothetical protein